jgi:hypothetical protein
MTTIGSWCYPTPEFFNKKKLGRDCFMLLIPLQLIKEAKSLVRVEREAQAENLLSKRLGVRTVSIFFKFLNICI